MSHAPSSIAIFVSITWVTLVTSLAGSAAAQAPGQWTPTPAPTPSTAPQPSPWGGMQAGGLAPPPPLPVQPAHEGAAPGSGGTEELLDKSKQKDSGRGLEWVWVNVEGGYQHVGLQTFNTAEQAFTAGFVPTTANGGVIGGGIGVRLLFFTLGARGRVGFLSPYNLFSLGPEIGFHIPIGSVEPHLEIGAGYAALGSFQGTAGMAGALSMHGFYARLGGGADYYFTPVFSAGINVSVELLGLTRAAISKDDLTKLETQKLTADELSRAATLLTSASSDGTAFGATGVIGLHF